MVCFSRATMVVLVVICLAVSGPALAAPPDFNADRRVNVKCPTAIEDSNLGTPFQKDGFKNTLRRLYHELDKNLLASAAKDGGGYRFSGSPNQGTFFVCHAKATLPAGRLPSLRPKAAIAFQEVFFITAIDWKTHRLSMVRQRDGQTYAIGVADFEKGFLWYNALLDKHKAYIPVYGFLSLPGEADAYPTIWDSWQGDKKDTATPPESLVDYDFYKILDMENGHYLLGKDFNELDYRDSVEDFGIIGWVEKKYITLWRSRLYYHPKQPAAFYDSRQAGQPAVETGEINRFYVRHTYLKERLFRDIVEKLDQESLHRFYRHFGFPQLTDPQVADPSHTAKVFIPGAFTPRLMKLLAKTLKKNLNAFFLLDVSESMRPFADYVRSFNQAIGAMQRQGMGLRVNRTYAFWDSAESDRNIRAQPNFIRVRRPEALRFVHGSKDRNYSEPLMRALTKTLDEIAALQSSGVILPLQEKLLFVITDAGANDLTEEILADTAKIASSLNLSIYFVYPKDPGVAAARPGLDDTPGQAFKGLKDLIGLYESMGGARTAVRVRRFEFEKSVLASEAERQKDFMAQQQRLLGGVRDYIDHALGGAKSTEIPRDVILYFSDEQLLTEMRRWSDRKIQVLNHVVKFIRDTDDENLWEERIAIPAKPVEAYLRAVRTQDDVSLSDLKKLVIINSLVSVDDIATCRKLYDSIKPLIEKRMFKTADAVFYKALTNKAAGPSTRWNRALGENQGPLTQFLAERGFHLNAFHQAVQRKFMYLRVDELYDPDSDGQQ